ncbi:hypothetical protein SAMN06265337_3076 [Hymenobacter gelipurpurascens]|uniref:Uncharacterized protein n=1 Tax=Hymenobacter gelipurpurascens TaxID=89968 RepID=A0A212UCM2_9BACT|nr:hypothetical protein SAMN06265337_3076 [Hymenobacter gelipurpurascens]
MIEVSQFALLNPCEAEASHYSCSKARGLNQQTHWFSPGYGRAA